MPRSDLLAFAVGFLMGLLPAVALWIAGRKDKEEPQASFTGPGVMWLDEPGVPRCRHP